MTTVMFKFQYHKGTINLEFTFFGLNFLSTYFVETAAFNEFLYLLLKLFL